MGGNLFDDPTLRRIAGGADETHSADVDELKSHLAAAASKQEAAAGVPSADLEPDVEAGGAAATVGLGIPFFELLALLSTAGTAATLQLHGLLTL